jgi:hypothetical protein
LANINQRAVLEKSAAQWTLRAEMLESDENSQLEQKRLLRSSAAGEPVHVRR